MTWQRGEMCHSCAGRKGTEANDSPETVKMLKECIAHGEPFYCHESTAALDPDGTHLDSAGDRYRMLPFERWRLCRAWMNAQPKHYPHSAAVTDGPESLPLPLMNQISGDDADTGQEAPVS